MVFCFLTALPADLNAQNFGKTSSGHQERIWNPERVDWWVSMDDAPNSPSRQQCDVHWLYDDAYDLSLSLAREGVLYFAFAYKEGVDDKSPFAPAAAATNMRAYLVVNEDTYALTATGRGEEQRAMLLSGGMNSLEFLRGAERVLLQLGATVYNFPLENLQENLAYFETCMRALELDIASTSGAEIKSEMLSDDFGGEYDQITPLPDESTQLEEVNIPIDPAIQAALFAPVAENSQTQPGILEESTEMTPQSEAAIYSTAKQKDADWTEKDYLNKRAEALQDSLEQEAIRQAEARSEAQSDFMYDVSGEGSSIIRSLTRKLSLVEKEKEELRLQLLRVSENEQLREIVSCSDQTAQENETSMALSDDLMQGFKSTIENLRAENELLREALLNSEDAASIEGAVENFETGTN